MGSQHTYDLSNRKRTGKMGRDGMEVNLDPSEMGMDEQSLRKRLEEKMRQKQAEGGREDTTDMVRDHLSYSDRKRRARAARERDEGYPDKRDRRR